MIPHILLPRYFKWLGLLLALGGFTDSYFYTYNLDDVNHQEGLFIQIAILIGFLMIAGSRQKTEDEMIRHIRLTSLQWSVFVLIGLRLSYKSVAFLLHDTLWLPHFQINSLLLLYLLLFYFQLYAWESICKLFKKGDR